MVSVSHLHVSVFNTPHKFKPDLREKSWISFCKIVQNKQYHLKVLLNSFHLNGYTLGFHPQTQKLEKKMSLSLGDFSQTWNNEEKCKWRQHVNMNYFLFIIAFAWWIILVVVLIIIFVLGILVGVILYRRKRARKGEEHRFNALQREARSVRQNNTFTM